MTELEILRAIMALTPERRLELFSYCQEYFCPTCGEDIGYLVGFCSACEEEEEE